MARRTGQEVRRARRAVDALRSAYGGVLHADARQDHEGPEGARRLLMAGKTTRVVMPQLGESVHEGTISRWIVKPGDKVVEFEPMLEVDTDKVNAEVPAPVSGILREILAKEGETVQAGAEIAVVETGDGAVTATPEAPAPAPKPEQLLPTGGEVPAKPAEGPTADSGPHRYSPGVQMAASELKVDLSKVTGTGLGGRVTKKDVQDFAAKGKAAPPASAPAAAPVAAVEGDQVVQLTRVRRLIAENMTRSKQTIPHAWQTQEVDMSGVVSNRAAAKGAFQRQEGFSLTYLTYVMATTIR